MPSNGLAAVPTCFSERTAAPQQHLRSSRTIVRALSKPASTCCLSASRLPPAPEQGGGAQRAARDSLRYRSESE
eukprot:CAMPEP_0115847584 /NCGR_PEP_ID=MMETSP0287-20121206/10458_1 /TAXON_ID=412157 /ORGANISM="Chrysochromulina rotalis, Strain UIO044" /LENGTH=73 /DNA_ID=CAMNT_0003301423 /DNA_START=436 /DNA_END=654 /DNA_ORIENTATION=-